MGSSKTARLKRRQAARRKRKRMLRRQGRMPVHTRTERRRAALERQRERQALRRRSRHIRRVAGFAVAGIGTVTVLGQAVPAAASARPPAAVMRPVRSLYLDYLFQQAVPLPRQVRPELPHDDGPDVTQDAFVPYIVTGAASSPEDVTGAVHRPRSSYSRRDVFVALTALGASRQDEVPHNELPDPAGYPGEWSTMGTASITPGRTGPHYSGGAIPQPDGYERYRWNWPTL
jgi:hypothetical protein